MNSDCAFQIGRRHAVCQDYAAVSDERLPHIVLSDGCSSSPDTDIGARLLVKSAQAHPDALRGALLLDTDTALARFHATVIAQARRQARSLRLDARCLDATLLLGAVVDDRWRIAIYGDGLAAAKRRDGTIDLLSVSYSDNAPGYLNYLGDAGRTAAFLAASDNVRRVQRFTLYPDGTSMTEEPCPDTGARPWCGAAGSVEDYEWIALVSDGVHSFTGSNPQMPDPISVPTLLRDLLDFKNLVGSFVQRRARRFATLCAARRWQHDDDIAIAAIAFQALRPRSHPPGRYGSGVVSVDAP